MQWATVVYFTKTAMPQAVFGFMQTIRENYNYYSALYNFSTELFRNDYTLSIALQIMSGYGAKNFTAIPGTLISANTAADILEVKPNGEIVFTWQHGDNPRKVTKIRNTNIHVMNKKTITDSVILAQLEVLAQ
jgi:hypothetical protein